MTKQLTIAVLLVVHAAIGAAAAEPHPLVGTWKKIAGRQGMEGVWQDSPAEFTMLKHITPTHVSWAVFQSDSKNIVAAMGGPVEMDDKNYVETVEHGLGPITNLLGKRQPFTWKIDSGIFTQAGTLSNGVYIEERFERMPQREAQP